MPLEPWDNPKILVPDGQSFLNPRPPPEAPRRISGITQASILEAPYQTPSPFPEPDRPLPLLPEAYKQVRTTQHWRTEGEASQQSFQNQDLKAASPSEESPERESLAILKSKPQQESNPTRLSVCFYSKDAIPYQHLDYLGHGNYGYVDKVQSSAGQIYARKVMRISNSLPREMVENEARIIQRLRHPHIIRLEELYQCGTSFGMIMLPVADTDLREMLELADSLNDNRQHARRILSRSCGCLIQAIDYLHEMRVKHKDIKPANILIRKGKPILADFGIAKEILDEETTASLGSIGPHTYLYCAPEVAFQEGRRGKASDIFSLGCVFLEIATTIHLATANELTRFRLHRQGDRESSAYATCAQELLDWINHTRFAWTDNIYTFESNGISFFRHHALREITQLAFLMLDPDCKTRITARQLTALLNDRSGNEHFTQIICKKCAVSFRNESSYLPLHSEFKEPHVLSAFTDPEASFSTPASWDDAKREWLTSHMWW